MSTNAEILDAYKAGRRDQREQADFLHFWRALEHVTDQTVHCAFAERLLRQFHKVYPYWKARHERHLLDEEAE